MEAAERVTASNMSFFRNAFFSSNLTLVNRLKLLRALAFQSRQAKTRRLAAKIGATVPPVLIASVTRACNLSCSGCYSRQLRPADGRPELSDDRLMEVFEEAIRLGVGTILIAGGEPFVRRDLLLRASRLKGVLLPVFTNGTMMDSEWAEVVSGGNLVPVFSVEGGETETDGRRGPGIHAKALDAMKLLRSRGALFGASVTVTRANAGSVLSDAFADYLASLGIAVLFLIEYVPVVPGTDNLVLESDQRLALGDFGKRRLPFASVTLPGDEEKFGGCLAAGRGFVHVAADGALEACPFAPFSDVGVADRSLAAALESPLMREIRARHSELTETRGGCALWNRQGWVASLTACGSAHSA